MKPIKVSHATLLLLLVPTIFIAPCMSAAGSSCDALVQEINKHRFQNGMEYGVSKIFPRRMDGMDAEGCARVLQTILSYGTQVITPFGLCDEQGECSLSRADIKRGIAQALLGRHTRWTQNFDFNIQPGKTDPFVDCLFPLYLLNYFADEMHDHHQVTVKMRRLNHAVLDRQAPFQPFLLQAGEIGEHEDVVPVIPMQTPFFYNRLESVVFEHRIRARHLDLMAASLAVEGAIPADAAVLVSGFQSFSTGSGEAKFSEKGRQILFLDAETYANDPFFQYIWANVVHQLIKVKAGFSAVPKDRVIETGLWGCGIAYGGDEKLRLLIQMLAAAETGHRLVFQIFKMPTAKIVEFAEFLTAVTEYHPRAVLDALREFLPHLVQQHMHLSEPDSTQSFLARLAQQPSALSLLTPSWPAEPSVPPMLSSGKAEKGKDPYWLN
jgi:hypothetical protein